MEGVTSVLVTGSGGFVGRALVKKLRENGADVEEFDITDGRDATDFKSFNALKRVDTVVHLAARTFVPDAFENPARVYRENIGGTLNVLEYCRLNSIKKIVYASSYVYGRPERLPIDERHATGIQNPYGRSKLIGEALCRGYYEDYGIVPVIFRPFNIYGPGQGRDFLIPSLIRQCLSTSDTIVVKDLLPRRDYVYIDDVTEAYLYAVFNYKCTSPEIFNIGSGTSYSVRELIDRLQSICRTDKKIISEGQARKNEIPDCTADTDKISRAFGWTVKCGIDEGLRETVSKAAPL
ncbi:NAD-dependent epimerase/dehydratase family protein [Candidatus Magnetominusculus dajiuhuensis]|uniref:NAD-dependent epimerase/dehydratase family protein n=1 Tax=Candidatus Magnetominusculus dajiuhuensis TaxID=3137712 RepID=UPI003B437EFA